MLLTPKLPSVLTSKEVKTEQKGILQTLSKSAETVIQCMVKSPKTDHCYEGMRYLPGKEPTSHYSREDLTLPYPKHYPVLIDEPMICSDNPFLLLIFQIHPSQVKERVGIRATYGKINVYKDLKIRVLFFTTVDTDKPENNEYLAKESEYYHDIVQFDLINHFLNGTIFDMLAFNWTNVHCHFTPYVAKIPFHGFANMTVLVDEYLYKNRIVHKHFLLCAVFRGSTPVRDPASGYYLPDYLFRGKEYPPYPADVLQIYSIDMIEAIYDHSNKFLPLHYLANVMIGQFLQLDETSFTDIVSRTAFNKIPPVNVTNYLYSERYSPSDLLALFKSNPI